MPSPTPPARCPAIDNPLHLRKRRRPGRPDLILRVTMPFSCINLERDLVSLGEAAALEGAALQDVLVDEKRAGESQGKIWEEQSTRRRADALPSS